jgi:hypothetical protein
VDHDVLLVLVGAGVAAGVGGAGWLVKRLFQGRDNTKAFIESRVEQRNAGFAKFLAAVDALQFVKADHYVRAVLGKEPAEYSALLVRASRLVHAGADEVRSNSGDPAAFEVVSKYYAWVFLEDHPPAQTPGIDEYRQIRNLVVQCKRVYQNQDRPSLLSAPRKLSSDHAFENLKRLAEASGATMTQTTDGALLVPMSGDAMAEYFERGGARVEEWKASRDLARDRLRDGDFFDEIPDVDY